LAAKKRKTKKEIGNRLKVLAGFLVILVIIAFGTARYFNTAGGRIFLLDIGLDGKYASVQREIGANLLDALEGCGIRRDKIEIIPGSGDKSGRAYLVKASVPKDYSLIRINNAIDKGIERCGGRVRSCHERNSGNKIEMEIGTRTQVTHICVIEKSSKAFLIKKKSPAVAVVVDDFGFFNNRLVREFLAVKIDITIAVIPGLKYSSDICRLAGGAGKDVLCHLPMEPEQRVDDFGKIPFVRVSMSNKRIRSVVESALTTTPGVVGMNNHMGSKATADSRVMKVVLGVCHKHNLFFFDSLTSSRSVASEMASTMGMSPLRNDIFLDNSKDDIRRNMEKLMNIASRRGWALGIMHVKRDSLRDLEWMIKEAEKRGIRFVTLREISDLIKES
jgi:polysaccharide deacetylase 2 family uncharacterized protein YibQ